MPDQNPGDILKLTTDVVTAHLSGNQMDAEQLPRLIKAVYRALSTIDVPEAEPADPHASAVPVRKSVFPDFVVCLEDGKKLKMLKRHLRTSHGMTPDDYRKKWGLPLEYPMVAPSYVSTRVALAKQIALGRKKARPPTGSAITRMPARRARDPKA